MKAAWPLLSLAVASTFGCTVASRSSDGGQSDARVAGACARVGETQCVENTYRVCGWEGGQLLPLLAQSCSRECSPALGCVECIPDTRSCDGSTALQCRADGSGWDESARCDQPGWGCVDGTCVDLCARARAERSYEGCEFFAADLDNLVDAGGTRDASAQPWAVAVANPSAAPASVVVERNRAPFGDTPDLEELGRFEVAAGGAHTIRLPRAELDGSTPDGQNDGTHSALTSRAFRLRSDRPVIAYQFNPLNNEGVFSNDAALLLPSAALDGRYTVVAWPQTAGRSSDPDQHTDTSLRSFIAVLGTEAATEVRVTLGPHVRSVVGVDGTTRHGPGDVIEATVGPFDALNLETDYFGADFSGTAIVATRPVAVFAGNEAADVPAYERTVDRQPAADHLEEQLLPDIANGTEFVLARMPARSSAVAAALTSSTTLSVVDEPEWARITALGVEDVQVTTSLPAPDAMFTIRPGEVRTLRFDRDAVVRSDRPIAVQQYVGGQSITAIPPLLPGGDPASFITPPTAQFRRRSVFLVPDGFAFDFVTVVAPRHAIVKIDGGEIEGRCPRSSIGEYTVHRCQFGFPVVTGSPTYEVRPGHQSDGVHSIESDQPVGSIVYGFDRYVSYAYLAGLDIEWLR